MRVYSLGSKLVLIVSWLAFAGLWYRVFQHTGLHEVAASLRVVMGLTLVYGAIVAIWVVHNISLARRRNRRKATREISVFPSHDTLGLPIEIRSDLINEQEIDIRIVEGAKNYSPRRAIVGRPPLEVTVPGHRGNGFAAEQLKDESMSNRKPS